LADSGKKKPGLTQGAGRQRSGREAPQDWGRKRPDRKLVKETKGSIKSRRGGPFARKMEKNDCSSRTKKGTK